MRTSAFTQMPMTDRFYMELTQSPMESFAQRLELLHAPPSGRLNPRAEINQASKANAFLAAARAGEALNVLNLAEDQHFSLHPSLVQQGFQLSAGAGHDHSTSLLLALGAVPAFSHLAAAVRETNAPLVEALSQRPLGTQNQRTTLLLRTLHKIDETVYPTSLYDTSFPKGDWQRHQSAERIALALIRQKVNLHTVNCWGQSILGIAASKGHQELVQALLNHQGLDVNHRDRQGNTALMLTLTPKGRGRQDKHPDERRHIVKALLDAGADPGLGNYRKETPLSRAAERPMPRTLQMLLNRINQ